MKTENEKSIDIIYKEIQKYNFEEQIEILKDCGLSNIVDSHKLSGEESFRIILKLVIGKIRNKYGEKIKSASWNGIYNTISKNLTPKPPRK